ncbi:3alpha(or 20beta)-hydroxysteroid dehydrogenase [Paraburkholderia sp. BL27I4N3]|uniref:SDR family NAD(P)-dependent oxidoreductase n=1 Tax=Paraburkholderia sp. BL27I4N3 TaxID=1938805 RepID=UPI000E2646B0|nr:SDR family oxidoreductase [Paraburkholderia sp. BL27I4N3]REE06477.1 3alpha(or 20beta)-hydroxysteroid dehydrogenase [Paraburkholderia sp. BL27I4N3]
MFSLKDKVAIITGGSSGIGAAAARRFCTAGAKVIIAARHDATALAQEIGATFIRTDVTVEKDVQTLMDSAAERFGQIDILLNNAGSFDGFGSIEAITAEDMSRLFAINTIGPFFGMKYAAAHMRSGSVIINTSSLAGLSGVPEYSAYAASKFALNGLTLCAAIEFGPRGIRVNAICPPSVNTPMLAQSATAEVEAALTRTTSTLNRIIEPEEVAALMHFLASEDCPTFTGQLIRLDAGMNAGYSIAMCGAIASAAGFAG